MCLSFSSLVMNASAPALMDTAICMASMALSEGYWPRRLPANSAMSAEISSKSMVWRQKGRFKKKIVPERKIRFWVGWVEPFPKCWVSCLNPTYEFQTVAMIKFQQAKPNKSVS